MENANYPKMYNFYKSLDKSVYLICYHRAKKENFPFKVEEIFPFPDDCISYWNEYDGEYIKELVEYVSQLKNKTFLYHLGLF